MGEVYRARDTRLGRDVAIKVLPPHLSENADARARFEREARAISGLTHPHICTLHDVGHQEGIDYLVMELLEGETLADRLEKGPLPLEHVFRCGVEIADALERAHRAGIVHRDLKPGNVMLTKSGVKLLDFGLARVAAPKAAVPELSALPTEAAESRPLTAAGAVMGTVQYMAPEQLEGKDADARTDIFAFGCVLYEMATGKRAFSGASQASLISSIMSSEPAAISTLAPMTPPALDRVVRICLAKDPDERWQSAHDVKSELQWIAQAGSQAGLPPMIVSRRKSRERLIWAAAVVAAAAGAALLSRRFLAPSGPPREAVRFELAPPSGAFQSLALSPDGRTLAFTVRDGSGFPKIWIRPLDSVEAHVLGGTNDIASSGGGLSLAWSPDSRSLAFPAARQIRRIDVAGGAPELVCPAGTPFGLSWGAAGALVFVPFYGSGIARASASGGRPSPVTTVDRKAGEVAHLWPRFLPDGRRFLFFIRTRVGRESHQGWIASASLDQKGVTRIRPADGFVGAGQGYLLFTIAGALYAQRFDPGSLTVRGEPAAISGRPVVVGSVAYPGAEVGGSNLVFLSDPPKLRRLVVVDRAGRELAQVGAPEPYDRKVAISPDGRRALVMRLDPEKGEDEIRMLDLERGTSARSGSGVEEEGGPVWSPDGSRFVLNWDREGPYDLVIRQADGSKPDEVVARSDYDKIPQSWSRDGRFILFQDQDPKNSGLAVLTVGSSGAPVHVKGSERASNFELSPDGRWLLWTSAESGRSEVYVQRFPDASARQQVSVDGGASARWSPDGKEIFFVSPEPKLMAVSIEESSATPHISIPSPLFPLNRAQREELYPGSQAYTWDVFPDGKRFLLLEPVSATDRSSITVVLNWMAQLSR